MYRNLIVLFYGFGSVTSVASQLVPFGPSPWNRTNQRTNIQQQTTTTMALSSSSSSLQPQHDLVHSGETQVQDATVPTDDIIRVEGSNSSSRSSGTRSALPLTRTVCVVAVMMIVVGTIVVVAIQRPYSGSVPSLSGRHVVVVTPSPEKKEFFPQSNDPCNSQPQQEQEEEEHHSSEPTRDILHRLR